MSFEINPDGALTFVRGDDLHFRAQFPDASGTPMHLAGHIIRAQIRSKPRGHIKVSFTCTVDSTDDTWVDFTTPHSVTEAIRGRTAWWDIEDEAPTGEITTLLWPVEVEVVEDITWVSE